MTETRIEEESTTEPVRRLVTVQRIVDLIPIDGKDRIELAKVLGYRVIAQKGLHRIGDLVAFHEEGSFVPVDAPHYADLIKIARLDNTGKARARIKTIKMGGVYSQGYVVPLKDLALQSQTPEVQRAGPLAFTEGDDLTALLDVVKYDDAIRPGASRGPPPPGMKPWPSALLPGISKTAEERLQSAPFLLDEMKGKTVYITGKMDGSSVTVARLHDGRVLVCSRNQLWERVEGEPVPFYVSAVEELGIAAALPKGYAVQGELCGPGIQKNRMGFERLRFFVFNAFRQLAEDDDFVELSFKEARGFVQDHKLQFVPLIQRGLLLDGRYDVDWFVARAAGERYSNGYPAEGLVLRPEVVTESRKLGRRLSTQIINPLWEEKQGKAAERAQAGK